MLFHSGKERRALEEELLRQQDIIGVMRQALAWVADSGESAGTLLLDIERNQDKIDQSLDHAVSAVHQIQEAKAARAEAREGLQSKFMELIDSCQQGEEAYRQSVALAREQQQIFRGIREKRGQLEEPLSGLNEKTEKLAAVLEDSHKDVDTMKEQGRTMSVLALNAAIEAGRMGEPGRQFVMAAEDVRGCAEEYKHAAERMEKQLAQMEKELKEASGQLVQLTGELEGHNAELEDAGQGFDQCVEKLSDGQLTGHASRLQELSQDWEQATEDAAGNENYCEQILHHLETAGEERAQEHQLLERLNSLQEQIMEAIRERRTWV